MSHWRPKAAVIITEIIQASKTEGLDLAGTKNRISEAYPWGQRQYHPYKIWLDESKKQLAMNFAEARPKLELRRATNWQQIPLGGMSNEPS